MRKLKLLTLIIAIAFLASCKKYPDNPPISLRSKTERVANTWNVPSIGTLILTKGGSATFSQDGSSVNGAWKFENNKANIYMTFNATSLNYPNGDTLETIIINCQILELVQNEMKLKGVFTINTIPKDPNNTGTTNIGWTLKGNN